jgi:hypothetical protein
MGADILIVCDSAKSPRAASILAPAYRAIRIRIPIATQCSLIFLGYYIHTGLIIALQDDIEW